MPTQVPPPSDDETKSLVDEATYEIKATKRLSQDQSGDLFAASAAAAGVPVPDHLKTKNRRWLVLIVVALAGACAQGPIASWPTLEPLLIKDDVFAGSSQVAMLSQIYSIAQGTQLIAMLPSGLCYDVLGARWVSAVGAWGCAVSLLLMAVSVKVASMNWVLWISYPAATFFGALNRYGVYAWYWLLPEHQNSVSSIVGAVQILSDSFVMLAVFLHSSCGVAVHYYFCVVAGFSVLAGLLSQWLVPTLDEQNAHSSAVIKHMYSQSSNTDAQYGSFDGESRVTEDGTNATRDSASSTASANISAAYTWSVKMYPAANCLFVAYQFLNYMWSVYPTIEMFPLYQGLMGTKTANQLVNIWGSLNGVAGMASILCFGRFVDKFGYLNTIMFLIPPTILTVYFFSVRSFDIQVVAQVLLAFFTNTWYVIAPRFTQHYAPAELFGIISGLQGCVVGVGQQLGTPLSKWIAKSAKHTFSLTGGGIVYVFSISLWCALYVAATGAMVLYWRYRPLPEVGSVSMADIRGAACSDDISVGEDDDKDCPDVCHKTMKTKKNEDCEKGDLHGGTTCSA